MRDVEEIMSRGKRPIIVGGSMLYVQSLVDAWSFPPTDPAVRAKYEAELQDVGIDAMHAKLEKVDPQAASIIEDKDPRRTVRALEVIELTGKPFQASQPPKNAPPRWNACLLGLQTESEWLNPRIELRTTLMFEQGLVAEVEELISKGLVRDSTAGRAIGYAQVLQAMDGELDWDEAVGELLLARGDMYAVNAPGSTVTRESIGLMRRSQPLPQALSLLDVIR